MGIRFGRKDWGMSKSKHTEAQIIAARKQVEAGRKGRGCGAGAGRAKHTIYAWKAKYGGTEVSEAEDVKHLRDENTQLKKSVADLSLDKDMLQSAIRKNFLGSWRGDRK
jgi:putative transposase